MCLPKKYHHWVTSLLDSADCVCDIIAQTFDLIFSPISTAAVFYRVSAFNHIMCVWVTEWRWWVEQPTATIHKAKQQQQQKKTSLWDIFFERKREDIFLLISIKRWHRSWPLDACLCYLCPALLAFNPHNEHVKLSSLFVLLKTSFM